MNAHEQEDPLAPLLQPLVDATWQGDEHRRRLHAELDALPRPRSRRALLLAAAAGGAVAAMLLAATGGARFLQRLFGLEVVDVERDAEGNIERITVHADDATTVQLRPWTESSELERPVPVTLPRHGGGEVKVHVHRDRDLHLLPRFVQVGEPAPTGVTPGARYTVRQVPCPWAVVVTAHALTLHAVAGGSTVVLPRIPTAAGTLARYGNDRALLEVLDP